MLNPQTQSKTLRPRSKTKKVSLPINKDLSSLVSNWKTAEPFLTTTFKRSLPFTWSSDSEEVCKSSSRPSLVRPSPSMSNPQTPLRTSKPRSRTRKASHPINRDWSSPASNLRTAELFQITTSRRNLPCTWSSDWEVVHNDWTFVVNKL